MNDEIGKKIRETNGKVQLASTTFEIVKIPTLNVSDEQKKKPSN